MVRRIGGLFLLALLFSGCASEDKKVTIGEPGQKGTYKRGVDSANDVAGKATESVRQGEQDVYGK